MTDNVKPRRRRGLLPLLVLALLAWLTYQALRLPPAFSQPILVDIESGTSVLGIAGRLQQAGVLRSRWPFLAWHYLRPGRRTLKAGEYRFERPVLFTEVYGKLARGEVFYHMVTIPEGYNLFEASEAVEKAGLASRAQFLDAARNTALVVDLAPRARTLEGFLFPETYRFSRRTTPRDMVVAMVTRFRQVYGELERKHRQASRAVSSNEQRALDSVSDSVGRKFAVLIIASMVEKETARADERTVIAGVYYNRLAGGLPLQCDPTVIYAALLDRRYRGAIYQSDLEYNSPYNTYVHTGLPPGPVANPGRASLEAALEPAATDYLYFVSNGEGRHVFSRTLEEHERSVAEYRRKTNTSPGSPPPAQPAPTPSQPTPPPAAGHRRASVSQTERHPGGG